MVTRSSNLAWVKINPMDRGASRATGHGVPKSRTRLSDFTFTFHFHPNPGNQPMSLMSPALAGGFFTTSTTWEAPIYTMETSKWYTTEL